MTSTDTTSKMLDRIKKLLAIAEHPNTPGPEAETAQAAAERLMVKHGIELAQLVDAGVTKEEMVKVEVFFTGTYRQGLSRVYSAIEAYGTTFLLMGQNSRRLVDGKWATGDIVYIIGRKTEVEKMVTLARSLEVQAMTAVARWAKTEGRDILAWQSPTEKFRSRRQFIISFMMGARDRVASIVREEAPKGSSTDLVLVNQRDKAKDAAKEMFGGWRNASGAGLKGGSYAAGEAGREAGRNANINQGAVGSRGRIGG